MNRRMKALSRAIRATRTPRSKMVVDLPCLFVEADGVVKMCPGRKWINRRPVFRLGLRQNMMDRLTAEVKKREVNELADKIGLGKSRTKRAKKVP